MNYCTNHLGIKFYRLIKEGNVQGNNERRLKMKSKKIMSQEERLEKMRMRKERSFIANHPDFPTHFSLVCLVLVIFHKEFECLISRMISIVQEWILRLG